MTSQGNLVSTEWVQSNIQQIKREDGEFRLIEVDVDTNAYSKGHIEGAISWHWKEDLNDLTTRDIVSWDDFEKLLQLSGITKDTTVLLYGDNNNWFAAFAFWLLKYYGHPKVHLVDGGRKKWELEGRDLTTEIPNIMPSDYQITEINKGIRALRSDVEAAMKNGVPMVDVRSPKEYSGEILAPPGLNETCQRGGHIPGAINIPWSTAVKEDGSYESPDKLRQIYQINPGMDKAIAYCRIGERSSHTWFALKYLLGLQDVKNYDGSWTEWGNLIAAPITKGSEP
ncbi:MAG: sulfurtransferase [Candidatus Heimdallarchaeota archaeon]